MDRQERDRHERFLREAMRLAAENVRAGVGGPFGALVVREGEIVARGMNRVTLEGDPTAHAEIVAIREACRKLGSFQLDGCDVYTSSEPCPMCLGAIYWARPRALYFATGREAAAEAGFDDGLIYEELAKPAEDRSIRMQAVEVEGSEEPFRLWLASEDRIEY
ncbi:MAG: nucleoside deaminase [Gemmatimonadota bacterium]